MTDIQEVSSTKCFGGWLQVYSHYSSVNRGIMKFSVYFPPQAEQEKVPVLYWLSGLTCTEENFMIKAGAQRYAAEHGIAIVAPDTSPRDARIDGEDESWDFGTGAGFYVNATQEPWSEHYNMYDYIVEELPEIVNNHFPVDTSRQSISGHSMGGHGALVIALRNPGKYLSVSAFAPISAPIQCPWGVKAFTNYLGENKEEWQKYDASYLMSKAKEKFPVLVDQGDSDNFLKEQLKPELLQEAAKSNNFPLSLRMQNGYDHSFYFVASFIGEHIKYHSDYFLKESKFI